MIIFLSFFITVVVMPDYCIKLAQVSFLKYFFIDLLIYCQIRLTTDKSEYNLEMAKG